MSTKTIIGAKEWCSLPSLGAHAIKARIDTGAKTSSIHAFNIKKFHRDNDDWVRFEIHPLQNNHKILLLCEAPIADRRRIKSSNGRSEKRYVIKTSMTLGGLSSEIELTLTNRDAMGHRMLLGREAMSDKVLVDPSENFILGAMSLEASKKIYAAKKIKTK